MPNIGTKESSSAQESQLWVFQKYPAHAESWSPYWAEVLASL